MAGSDIRDFSAPSNVHEEYKEPLYAAPTLLAHGMDRSFFQW